MKHLRLVGDTARVRRGRVLVTSPSYSQAGGILRTYFGQEWVQPQWDLLSHSYMFRLLTSLHPVYKFDRPETAIAETIKINGALFLKFQQAVIADGAKSLLVHLPSEGDILGEASESVGVKVLKSVHLAHVDVTPCMRSFSVGELFNALEAGGHYSVRGNRAAAQCLIKDAGASLQALAFR